ncbi:MAG: hypothetical protein IKR19_08025 [Acholeplasmatales bacterium]|nr:hypothetical protein [Acholeplasmatales bacterium]
MRILYTDNNEYKIVLNKSLRNSFLLKDSDITDAKYNIAIDIYNSLSTSVFSIKSNDIEIVNLIDTIETFLNYPNHFPDIFFSFAVPDTNMINKIIIFERYIPNGDNNLDINSFGLDLYGIIRMKLYNYSYITGNMVLVSSILIDNNIENFLNALYEEFIIDDNTGKVYNDKITKYISIE